jgi:glutaredoxin
MNKHHMGHRHVVLEAKALTFEIWKGISQLLIKRKITEIRKYLELNKNENNTYPTVVLDEIQSWQYKKDRN